MFVCATCGQRYPAAGFCASDGAPLAAADDPLLGSEIDRYRIARTLGAGGMGKVYLAVQPAIGSRVAIKLLSDECAKTPELVERFFAEARAVNLIRHEHIVSVLDMSRLPDGRPFIVMEFVEGQTLAESVRTSVAPLGGVLQVMGEVLAALAAAHAIGIVHRDLKPDNILVTAEGHAKVLDFGIAKLAPNLRDAGSATRTGALLGTPAYMAPEQISGAGNVDGRSDLYAAGVVLFEAVTGQTPFQGGSMFDLMRAHVEQQPPSPRALRPDLPPALEHVILAALAKDPAHRFQSATAMAQALAHAGTELAADQWRPLSSSRHSAIAPRISSGGFVRTTPQAPPTTAVATQRDRRGRRWLALVGLLVAGGVAAVAIGMHSSGGDREVVATAQTQSPASGPQSPASGPQSPAGGPSMPAPPPNAPPPPTPETTLPPPTPKTTPTPNTTPSHQTPTPTPTSTPTIVGGGSAADHGVFIGPNVHVGPGVVIGSNPPAPTAGKKSVTWPADYDPKHFDPVGYLGRAEAIAQQLLPDAKLTSFEFDPVWPDGHMDLTASGRDREFEFRSPSASKRPADVPKNVAYDRACMVHLEITPSGVEAEVRTSETCDAPLVRRPRCHFSGVWQQAIAAGTGRDVVARIAWLKDEQWFFDTDLGGGGGGVSSFPDACH